MRFNKAGRKSARKFNFCYEPKDVLEKTDHDLFPKEMADKFFELTKEIRQSNLVEKAIPILALTAHHEEEYREKAKQYGIDDFLVKPLTIEIAKEIFKKFNLLNC